MNSRAWILCDDARLDTSRAVIGPVLPKVATHQCDLIHLHSHRPTSLNYIDS
jgi:hypothetical protein